MKRFFNLAILLALVSCGKEYREWNVEIENTLATARADESMVLTREQLKPADNTLLPAITDTLGNYIPSQADDLDGDGLWDEMAFIKDFAPNEKAALRIKWVAPEDYPQFTVRTNVRYGLMTSPGVIEEQKTDVHYKELAFTINAPGYPYQMDGVAWENDKVGFRHYYDGRNCRDYFGKRVTDMVLDTVGIRANGFPGDTYHVWADWGRDIMSVGTSFGLGGLGAWVNGDHFVRMGRLNTDPTDVIDSTRYTLITEGPVRSIFSLDMYGWTIEESKVEHLRQIVTIWAGKHNYDNKVITTKLPDNAKLITGLARIFNDNELQEIKFNNFTAMATHDYQSYNKEFIMGMAVIIPDANLAKLFDTPNEGAELVKTWCAELNLDSKGEASYKAYGAWEHQDSLFRSRDYFMNFIKSEGDKLDNPVKISLK